MNITSAKYQNDLEGKAMYIIVVNDGVTRFVPLDPTNTDFTASAPSHFI